mgnify:CR=1 FL=1
MSSFVGILMSSRINSGDPNLSTSGIEFEIIVAIILGGTSLLGGQGSLIGTLIGALILGNLSNGMNLLGIGTVYQFIVEGCRAGRGCQHVRLRLFPVHAETVHRR